jgi:predicted transposase/invertase (TIGR01784 family)
MEIMERMPFKARKAVFNRLEQISSKANMSVKERKQYETEWKIYNDYFNTIDSAKREGREAGRAEGRTEAMIETARNLKNIGVNTEIIIRATGLSAEDIELL